MTLFNSILNHRFQHITTGIILFAIILGVSMNRAHGHGGKTHASGDSSALEVVQKALTAYDKLIVSGKLEQTWETTLRNIEVSSRQKDGKLEYRISFQRSEGSPKAVYIFYSANGDYTGSNFNGN